MNLYKTLIFLSCFFSLINSFFLYQIKSEPKIVEEKIIVEKPQLPPIIEIKPMMNVPDFKLSDIDKAFLVSLFDKTINLTIDHTKHSFADEILLPPIPEPKKAKVVK